MPAPQVMPLIQALRLLKNLGDNAFGAAHLPQDIGMNAPLPPGNVERLSRLRARRALL